jgi:hypothetical protein
MSAEAFRYFVVDDVMRRYGVARRTVHEWTRLGLVPHRVLPGTRRVLFEEEVLQAFDEGAELERVDLPNGGRIVRPVESPSARLRGVA